MTLQGIDVSNHQGMIAWPAVAAAGIQFAFVKASEGVNFADAFLPGNLAGMSAAGILRGVYHFALPAWNAPADEAAAFVRTFKPLSQAYDVIALDLEADPYKGTLPADVGSWARAWLTIVEAEFGCKPLIYTDLDLIDHYGVGALAAEDYGLWLAAPDSPNQPTPAPWTVMAVQQTSWTGSVAGIQGPVDLNTFFGDESQWRRYGIPADVPKPPIGIWDDAARLKTIGYIAGGSGPTDIAKWVGQYAD